MALNIPNKDTSEAYIRLFAPIVPETADKLFRILDQKIGNGVKRIHLLISSPGGSVFHGLSIYNYLKGAPIEVNTYNFGSVDSIGVIIFCAGSKRYSVPHARFLIHGVRFNINGNVAFDEKELEEHFKSLKIDQRNIAKVIADTCGKEITEIEKKMNDRTTLNPEEAKEYGLVHEIKSLLFPQGADLSVIGEINQPQIPFSVPNQPSKAFTRSRDLNVGT
jgi:ATP-dependent Clp protease protease subunit